MKKELASFLNYSGGPSVVVLGNFDGLHRGHVALLRRTIAEAKALGCQSILFTFDPHPKEVLGGVPTRTLLTKNEKSEILHRTGIDVICFQTFNLEFSKISAHDFVQKILIEGLHCKKMIVGDNFRFGKNAEGSVSLLNQIMKERLIICEDEVDAALGKISSTLIRKFVEDGKMQDAEKCLGYPFFVTAEQETGDGRGKGLGAPTLNFKWPKILQLKQGVYAVIAQDLTNLRFYKAVANWGMRPTFMGQDPRLEVHLLDQDFQASPNHLKWRLFFKGYLREEVKFENPHALSEQIKRDVVTAHHILDGAEQQGISFEKHEDPLKLFDLLH